MKIISLAIVFMVENICAEKEMAIVEGTIVTLEKETDMIGTMSGERTRKGGDIETVQSTGFHCFLHVSYFLE